MKQWEALKTKSTVEEHVKRRFSRGFVVSRQTAETAALGSNPASHTEISAGALRTDIYFDTYSPSSWVVGKSPPTETI